MNGSGEGEGEGKGKGNGDGDGSGAEMVPATATVMVGRAGVLASMKGWNPDWDLVSSDPEWRTFRASDLRPRLKRRKPRVAGNRCHGSCAVEGYEETKSQSFFVQLSGAR
ncbi:MAG: hypothetical protein AAF645_14485 [Myxococcota bacterium]